MKALSNVYQSKGAGKLFWCGYGDDIPLEVEKLIDVANENNREAYYISTDGFDSTMYSISLHCMSDGKEFIGKIESLKKQLSVFPKALKSKFTLPNLTFNKIVNTNAVPIGFPEKCYQFELRFDFGEKRWEYCRRILWLSCIKGLFMPGKIKILY